VYSQNDPDYPQPPAPLPDGRVRMQLRAASPTVTYVLMGVTVAIYLLQMAGVYLLNEDIVGLLGMKVNELIIGGQIWRLVTPMFLHDDSSILHIAFNMYALYAMGPGLERHYGHGRFLGLYFISGFAGNVLSFLLSPNPSWGASTAIFGLLGAEGVFLYQNRRLFGSAARSALINVVVIAGVNLMLGLSGGIDNWGHIGGLVAGVLFAWFAGPSYGVQFEDGVATLADKRDLPTVLTVGLAVWALFALLAGWKILF
jgi:rhomboid protease GluP